VKWFKWSSLITLSLAMSLSTACNRPADTPSVGDIVVQIIVTRDFGEEVIIERTIEVKPNTNAIDALKQVAAVETAYGSGFVNGVNGTRTTFSTQSGGLRDWFFSVNGITSGTGGLDYALRSGDVEQWDFHKWGFQQTIPATIGQFPEPFLHGHRGSISPTVVAYSDNFEKEANNLVIKLAGLGVKKVNATKITELKETERELSNLIIVGHPDELLASEINREWKRLGLFASFDGNRLNAFNSSGEVSEIYTSSTGVIMATQNLWNPNGTGAGENVAWLVSGTDDAGVKAAIDVLLNRSDEFIYSYGAIVSGGQVTRLPR
jgi:hypothetical protein